MNLLSISKVSKNMHSEVLVTALLMNIFDRIGFFGGLKSERVLRKLARISTHQRIQLFAETPNYSRLLNDFGFKDVKLGTLPIPRPIVTTTKKRGVSSGKYGGSNPKIGLLGSPRRDKGYDQYSKIISYLQFTNPNYIFYVQIEPNLEGKSELEESLASFKNVHFIRDKISHGRLQSLILQMDVLLLPYNEGIYQFRGSAMLTEAVSARTPVVCPAMIGVGRMVEVLKLGVTYEDFSGIPAAIETCLMKKNSWFGFEKYESIAVASVNALLGTE